MKRTKDKINWLNHFLEFLTVLIGILIAFQLNTWSTRKTQKQTIDTHLVQIVDETIFNKNSITSSINLIKTNLQIIDELFQIVSSHENINKADSLSLKLLDFGGLYIRKNAYQSLIESGDIRFMKRFEDKQRIINLYEYYKWIEGLDKMSIENYKNDFLPFMKTKFDLVHGRINNKQDYYSMAFSNTLVMYQYMLSYKIGKYEECLQRIDHYLK